MATHSDDEDFRGRKKQARILGYDAEAWIKAKREEREQFKAVEGKDMDGFDKLARDPRMEEFRKAHQERENTLRATFEQRKEAQGVIQDEEQKKLSDPQNNQAEQQRGRTM